MNFYNPLEQPARIRIIHAVPVAQLVDVYINDTPIVRGLSFRQSTQYITLPQGMYNIKIYTTDSNKLLLNQNQNIEGSKIITVTPVDTTDKIKLVITDEKEMEQLMPQMMMQPGPSGYGMGPGYGQITGKCPCQMGMPPYQMPVDQNRDGMNKEIAKVRFIHFSPNAPAVDITLPDGTKLFSNISYKGVTDYIEVDPGTYTLQVRPAGSNQVVLTIPNFKIGENEIKTIYAIGLVNGTPQLEAFVLSDKKFRIIEE